MIAEGILNNKKVVISSDRKNYWRYYGLKFDPFTSLPKDAAGYLPTQREQQFDILNYLSRSNNVLMTIIANKGVGKTMFLKQFLAQTDDSIQIQQLLGSRQIGFNQLIDVIEKGFSISAPQTDNQEEKLDQLLTSFQLQERRCLLVIDDAHLLPAETLNALIYFVKHQSESQMQFHILLSGQPLLMDTLSQLSESDTDQELIHKLDLSTFSAEETQGYIKYRLHTAGLPAAIPLSQFAIARIHKLSHGIPERINVIAKQYLIEAMQQKQINSATSFIKDYKTEVIGGGLILAILLLIATLWSHGSRYPILPSFNIFSGYHFKLPSFVLPHKANANAVSTSVTQDSALQGIAPVAQLPNFDTSSIGNDTSSMPQRAAQVNPGSSAIVPNVKNVVTTNNIKVVQAQPAAPTMPKAALNVSSATLPVNKSGVAKPAVAAMNQNTINNLNSTQQALLNDSSPAITSRDVFAALPGPQNAAPIAIVAANSVPAANQRVGSSSPEQQSFLAQNPNHFTLQLIGVSNEVAMKKFIAKNQLGPKAKYFHSHLNGKDWYVLVYGDYESRSAAQAAIQSLPSVVQSQHPWVRAVSSVQSSVRKQMTAANAQTTE